MGFRMEKESFTIVNENEHDIVGTILRANKTGKSPCIIFSHGLLDTSKSNWIKNMSKKFLDDGYAVIHYDATQGFGESGGRPENVTISQRARDLERVINYAKRRSYIKDKKIVVAGHCYGAMAALALEGFEHILAALVLISTPARIEESALTRKSSHDMMKIKLKRYFHIHHGDLGKEVRINYEFFEDGMKIDMDRAARNLKTPVIFFHGSGDKSIPPENSQRMFDRAIGPKRIIFVEKMEHDIKGSAITKIYTEAQQFLEEVL